MALTPSFINFIPVYLLFLNRSVPLDHSVPSVPPPDSVHIHFSIGEARDLMSTFS
ncbi:hypothetical protein D3C86_2012040 [compost metagenome]